jgi:hypothetical protein
MVTAPMTRTYVISAIDAEGDATMPDSAYGFDLDMADGLPAGAPADSCQGQTDFTSLVGGAPGVDNQLASVVSLLNGVVTGGVNGAITTQINGGKVLLMLEISEINSFTTDPAIRVHAALGQIQTSGPACAAITAETACTADTAHACEWTAAASGTGGTCATTNTPTLSTVCPTHTDQASCHGDAANGCGWSGADNTCSGLASGQTFAMLMDLGTVDGSITAGQLSSITDSLPLSFAVMGTNLTLTLHHVRFGGTITAAGIVGGQFGAEILLQELVDTANSIDPSYGALVSSVVVPDLDPSTADPTMCAGISAGMGYSAVSATLE